MFRNTWCASVETELSNALAAWTCDSRETLSEARTNMLDFSANHICVPPCGCGSRRDGMPQHAPATTVFCDCPRMAANARAHIHQSSDKILLAYGFNLISN